MIGILRSFYNKVRTLLFGVAAEPADTTPVSVPLANLPMESTKTPAPEADGPASIVEIPGSYSATIRCHDANGEFYYVNLARDYIDVTSCSADPIDPEQEIPVTENPVENCDTLDNELPDIWSARAVEIIVSDPVDTAPEILIEPPTVVENPVSDQKTAAVENLVKPAVDVLVKFATEIPITPSASGVSSGEWSVRTYVDPVFVKVGRVYLDAGDLIIRSDRDSRGFLLSENDVERAFSGKSGIVRLLGLKATVGNAHLSASGLALNIVIDKQLHTVPLRSLIPVLNGNHRKAPLFVPADDVAPDPLPV